MSAICERNRDHEADRPLDRAKLADTLMCMADPRCVLIKLADRLHNMRTIAALPEAKRHRMAQESMDIFSPLANRLGVWGLKAELEDLCFQQLYPVQHIQLHNRLQESQARGSIELALNKLKGHLDGIGKPVLALLDTHHCSDGNAFCCFHQAGLCCMHWLIFIKSYTRVIKCYARLRHNSKKQCAVLPFARSCLHCKSVIYLACCSWCICVKSHTRHNTCSISAEHSLGVNTITTIIWAAADYCRRAIK